ncbi:MAG: phage tail tube protein [Clostridia bacterium]|nr:phage tail tube protein [Clostridia bacterium]
MALDVNKIMNGTFGSLWLDGEEIGEAYGLEAKVEIQKEEVPVCGRYTTSEKFMGYKGTGTVKLRKVYSRIASKISDQIKKGVNPTFEILSELADPAAQGSERVLIKGVSFNELFLANWETQQAVNEDYSFTFTDWEFFDMVKA